MCKDRDLFCVYPLDETLPSGLSKTAQARWMYQRNIEMIRSVDIVMADVNHFRGKEPDSGTIFEVGFGKALGKQVWLYTGQNRTMIEQDADRLEQKRGYVDKDDLLVENFGLNLNLMLACSSNTVVGNATRCLDAIATVTHGGRIEGHTDCMPII